MQSVRMGSHGIRVRVLAVIAALVLMTLSLGAAAASADPGRHDGQHGRDAHNTFTKWITTYPAMAGVVGGAVGTGTYAGEILKYTPGATSADATVIEALYHFNGSKHSFTALVHVEQTGLKAVITGVVTDGWRKGDEVKGRYTQITCAPAPGITTCFQGTLDIER
jgi:hypothetical protein